MGPISKFLEGLKKHLKDHQAEFNEHHSWCGDTEGGFYDQDIFDFDKLIAEIDKFSESFKKP